MGIQKENLANNRNNDSAVSPDMNKEAVEEDLAALVCKLEMVDVDEMWQENDVAQMVNTAAGSYEDTQQQLGKNQKLLVDMTTERKLTVTNDTTIDNKEIKKGQWSKHYEDISRFRPCGGTTTQLGEGLCTRGTKFDAGEDTAGPIIDVDLKDGTSTMVTMDKDRGSTLIKDTIGNDEGDEDTRHGATVFGVTGVRNGDNMGAGNISGIDNIDSINIIDQRGVMRFSGNILRDDTGKNAEGVAKGGISYYQRGNVAEMGDNRHGEVSTVSYGLNDDQMGRHVLGDDVLGVTDIKEIMKMTLEEGVGIIEGPSGDTVRDTENTGYTHCGDESDKVKNLVRIYNRDVLIVNEDAGNGEEFLREGDNHREDNLWNYLEETSGSVKCPLKNYEQRLEYYLTKCDEWRTRSLALDTRITALITIIDRLAEVGTERAVGLLYDEIADCRKECDDIVRAGIILNMEISMYSKYILQECMTHTD